MLLNYWLGLMKLTSLATGSQSKRKPAQAAQGLFGSTERFEDRALLSAAPVVTLAPAELKYTEGSGSVVIAPNSTVTDIDSPTFDGGTLTASLANGTPEDRLAIKSQVPGQISVLGSDVSYQGTVIGSFTGGTNGTTPLVVTLNSSASLAAVQALQSSIAFEVVGDPASNLPRTFEVAVTDAANGMRGAATSTITVSDVKPVITLSKTSLNITNSSPTVIDAGLTITEPAQATLNGAVLTVSQTDPTSSQTVATSKDRLTLRKGSSSGFKISKNGDLLRGKTVIGTVTGGTSGTPLTITFNSEATLADVQKVASYLTFQSPGHKAHQVNVGFQFSDGTGGISDTASILITVGKKSKGPNGNGNGNGNGNS